MSVESAIYGKLHSDTGAGGLVNPSNWFRLALAPAGYGTSKYGIYHLQAPQDASYPYIIFQQQTGTPIDGMGGGRLPPPLPSPTGPSGSGILEDELWVIKGVDRQAAVTINMLKVKAIADRIDTLLKDAELGLPTTVDGSNGAVAVPTQRYFRREREMPTYAEREEDQFYVHAGSVFRLVYQ